MSTIGKTNFPPGGIDTSDATVVASDMKVGVTAYGAAGTKITGTMTVHASDQTASSITNSTTTLKFLAPAGFYDGSKYVTFTDADFAAGNIRVGYNIFGIDGTFTNDATATAGQILATVTAYVNGAKITGTMTNQGAYNITPGTSNQSIPAGYHNGSGVVYGDADLVAGNIKSGVNIFGVAGTFASGGVSISIGYKNNVNSPLIYATLFCLLSGLTLSSIYGVCMSESGQYVFYHYYNGSTYSVYKSNNYGITFSAKVNENNIYRGVVCSYDGKYVAIGNKISSDYGENFSSLPTNVLFSDMSYDGQIMYARKTDGYMYKSTDYGANWSNTNILGQSPVCSDDGSIVCFSRNVGFQNNNFYRTTDGLATEGSVVITGDEGFNCIISQDGSKYAALTHGTAGTPADSHKYMSIFNNGNYLTYYNNTGDSNRYCSYLDVLYYSKLFSIISPAQSQIPFNFSNRIKNTNKFCVIASNTIYILSQ